MGPFHRYSVGGGEQKSDGIAMWATPTHNQKWEEVAESHSSGSRSAFRQGSVFHTNPLLSLLHTLLSL